MIAHKCLSNNGTLFPGETQRALFMFLINKLVQLRREMGGNIGIQMMVWDGWMQRKTSLWNASVQFRQFLLNMIYMDFLLPSFKITQDRDPDLIDNGCINWNTIETPY